MFLANTTTLWQDGGVDWGRVLSEIPHDPASIFIYLLLVGFIVVVWLGNRSSSTSDEARPDATAAATSERGPEGPHSDRDASAGDGA